MKYLKQMILAISLVSFSTFTLLNQGICQSQINLTVGVGLPELFNIGARLGHKQMQIGINYGLLEGAFYYSYSYSGNFYYHFAGKSKHSNRSPLYGLIGITHLKDESTSTIFKFTYSNIRMGYEFGFSKRIGMNLGGGVLVKLSDKRTIKDNSLTPGSSSLGAFVPSVGLNLFYRFY